MLNFYQGQIQFSNHLFVGIDKLARRRSMSILVIFFLSFGGSWLRAQLCGIPVPHFQDEFSHLLAGDTFAHGRVTNPTHPMWEHFETFYVLQQPTYMSIYPPGQGIFLAIGQVVFGHPIYGVWLSAALMCTGICWMLYAWVSPRWALIGGLVAVMQFGIFTYWSQSYWGGAVAALGGALVFGALPRIIKYQRLRDALFLGLGIGILVNTRPLEGILVCIPVGCLVLPWKIRWRALDKRRLIKNAVVPLTLLILATALLTGAYNKKITGNAWMFPHVFYQKLYSTLPIFVWQPLYPPVHYNHKVIADYVKNSAISYYLEKRTWNGFIKDMQNDSFRISAFYLGYPLAVPSLAVLLLFFFHRQTAARFWMALLILSVTCAAMIWHAQVHYFSPFTCLAVLLITIGLRGLGGVKLRNVRVGLVFVIFLIALQLVLNIILTPIPPVVTSMARSIQQSSPINLPASFTREELKNILMKRGGKYLVIVKYFPWHNNHWEWVYNDADIDHTPIVWARDMDEGHNKRLLDYFKDRQVLLIQVYWDMSGAVHFYARQ